MILLIGHKGNMGRRYRAILDYYGIDWVGMDKGDPLPKQDISSIILATPTDEHYKHILGLRDYRVPILCEKPITKNPKELAALCKADIDLHMVNQYHYLQKPSMFTDTNYNYFKSGTDGIEWDCLNIVGLAKKKPLLSNSSPVWHCTLNGVSLDISRMDHAYMRMIEDWSKGKYHMGKDYIMSAHARVWEGWYVKGE